MSIYFNDPPQPDPPTKWFYTPGSKVLWVKELSEAFTVQVRMA